MNVICQVFRSRKEEGMYLYVRKEDGLSKVPEVLLQKFGTAEPAIVLVLTPDKKLARADITRVLAALDDPGYYLQLPPTLGEDQAMQAMRQHNSKLS